MWCVRSEIDAFPYLCPGARRGNVFVAMPSTVERKHSTVFFLKKEKSENLKNGKSDQETAGIRTITCRWPGEWSSDWATSYGRDEYGSNPTLSIDTFTVANISPSTVHTSCTVWQFFFWRKEREEYEIPERKMWPKVRGFCLVIDLCFFSDAEMAKMLRHDHCFVSHWTKRWVTCKEKVNQKKKGSGARISSRFKKKSCRDWSPEPCCSRKKVVEAVSKTSLVLDMSMCKNTTSAWDVKNFFFFCALLGREKRSDHNSKQTWTSRRVTILAVAGFVCRFYTIAKVSSLTRALIRSKSVFCISLRPVMTRNHLHRSNTR